MPRIQRNKRAMQTASDKKNPCAVPHKSKPDAEGSTVALDPSQLPTNAAHLAQEPGPCPALPEGAASEGDKGSKDVPDGWFLVNEDWEVLKSQSTTLGTMFAWRTDHRASKLSGPDAQERGFFLAADDLPIDCIPTGPPAARSEALLFVKRVFRWIVNMKDPETFVCHFANSFDEFVGHVEFLNGLVVGNDLMLAALCQGWNHLKTNELVGGHCEMLIHLTLCTQTPIALIQRLLKASEPCVKSATTKGKEDETDDLETHRRNPKCRLWFEATKEDLEGIGDFEENRVVDAMCGLSDRVLSTFLDRIEGTGRLWSHTAMERFKPTVPQASLLDVHSCVEFGSNMENISPAVSALLRALDERLGVPWKGVSLCGGFPFSMLFVPKASHRPFGDFDFFLHGPVHDQTAALRVLLDFLPQSDWDFMLQDERPTVGKLSSPPYTLTFRRRTCASTVLKVQEGGNGGEVVQIVRPAVREVGLEPSLCAVLGSFDFSHSAVALVGSRNALFHTRVFRLLKHQGERGSCIQSKEYNASAIGQTFKCDPEDQRIVYRTLKAKKKGLKVVHGADCRQRIALGDFINDGFEANLLSEAPRATVFGSSERIRDSERFKACLIVPGEMRVPDLATNVASNKEDLMDSEDDRSPNMDGEAQMEGREDEQSLRSGIDSPTNEDQERTGDDGEEYARSSGGRKTWLHSTRDNPIALEPLYKIATRCVDFEQPCKFHVHSSGHTVFLDAIEGNTAYYRAQVPNHPKSQHEDEQASTGIRLTVKCHPKHNPIESDWPVRARLPLMYGVHAYTHYVDKKGVPIPPEKASDRRGAKKKVSNRRLPRIDVFRPYAFSELKPF